MSALTVSILFSTRSRRLESTMVPPLTLMCSIEKASDGLPAAGFEGGLASLSRSRRSGKFATGRMIDELGDMRLAGPQAGERHLRLDACGREVAVDVAVLRMLQRDIVQRDVERWPQADPGAAIDGELVAGLALDPLLDLRRQEARRDADHQQQRDDDDHGANDGAGNFQCSHIDIPDRANGTYFGRRETRAQPVRRAYPGKRVGPKEAKNIPGVLQSYVTYDTLIGMGILLTA